MTRAEAANRIFSLEPQVNKNQLIAAFFSDIHKDVGAAAHLLHVYNFDVASDEPPSIDTLLGIEGLEEVFADSSSWAKWRFAYVSENNAFAIQKKISIDLTITDDKNEFTLRLLPADKVTLNGEPKGGAFQELFASTDLSYDARRTYPKISGVKVGEDKSIIFTGFDIVEEEDEEGHATNVTIQTQVVLAKNEEGIYELKLQEHESAD